MLAPGAAVPLPDEHEERAAYVVEGEVEVAGDHFTYGRMPIFRPEIVGLRARPKRARVLLLGAAAMDGPRYLFWNFVSSSHGRNEQATTEGGTVRPQPAAPDAGTVT